MSGNFTQRGYPALTDKFARAKMAVMGGADLVLELPLPYQCANARQFALGGVSLLTGLGCVDVLGFGCETCCPEELLCCAEALEAPSVQSLIQDGLKGSVTFAALQCRAVSQVFGPAVGNLLKSPNNTLAIAYLQALSALRSSMRPMGIPRTGSSHESLQPQGDFASASYLRQIIEQGKMEQARAFVPPLVYAELEGQNLLSPAAFSLMALTRLRTLTLQDVAGLPEVGEGMEHRIYKAIQAACDIHLLYDSIKTKRYTHARIRRVLLYGALGITREDFQKPVFARVLATNQRGQEVLKICKETATIPIVSRYAQQQGLPLSSLQNSAYALYNLCRCQPQPANQNMTQLFYYHKGDIAQ